jgi:hypothetical protein
MYQKSCRGILLAALCGLAAPAVAPAAPPLWKTIYAPLKRVEADPNKDYAVTENSGPWMIMAAAFSGDGAKDQARQLVLELREKYRLPAYLYQKKFDLGRRTEGRGTDRYGEPLKMRYARGESLMEIAVMVGDYPAVDDPEAQKVLKKIKHLEPAALDVNKRKTTSQTLANFRSLQKAAFPEGSDVRKKGPMGAAFIATNPLLPPEFFAPKGVDKLVVEMNKGVKHSLLDCKGRYSVKVATFNGQIVLDQKKIDQIEKGAKFKSRLQDAAINAHKVTEALREKGVEAYEFHDRYASIVTIGSFDSVGVPRADGKIEINPAMHSIIKTYGAEAKLLPGQVTPQLSKPKSIEGIPFDVSPVPVEVPRRSLAADYGRTAANP